MVDDQTRARLKQLYQALGRPIGPDDPAYIDLGGGLVEQIATTIEYAPQGTLQLLGGQRGTGKTTLLRALKGRLERDPAYKVVVCDLQGHLSLTEPIEPVDALLAIAKVLADALEMLGFDARREGYWVRFYRFLTETQVSLEPPLAVSLSTRDKPGFRERLKYFENSSIDTIRHEFQEFVRGCVAKLIDRHGPETRVVVLIEGFDQVHGRGGHARDVSDSLERFFVAYQGVLRIPEIHQIFSVPAWLRSRQVVFDGHYRIPCIDVREPGDRVPLALRQRGVELLRRVAEARGEAGWVDWLLGDTEAFHGIILASGGLLSDFIQLLRLLLTHAGIEGVPVTESMRQRAIADLGASHVTVSNQDAQILARIERTGVLVAENLTEQHRIDDLVGATILLAYRNGVDWYGIHPLFRKEILLRTEASNTRSIEARAPDDDIPSAAVGTPSPALRLASMRLEQIRCFEFVEFEFEREGTSMDWVLLLGDNGQGKSTVLRCIALGLCAELEASSLLEAMKGPLLRKGAEKGRITLTLRSDDGTRYRSVTEVTPDLETNLETERLRRIEWEPAPDHVFVCAYGTARLDNADRSYSGYSRHDAVYALVADHSMQNPELVLRRQDRATRARIERKLFSILMLDPERVKARYSARGFEIFGPWSSGAWDFATLPTLSDGYRSTTQWVIDLIGWLVHAGRFTRDEDMTGIVLVDELEQHLHVRWQRYIIAHLHAQFPGLQFIASTHTPLLALGLADEEHGLLVRLEKDRDQQIWAHHVDPRELRGLRADQVLTSSQGFGLPTTRSPGSSHDIARYSELAGKQRDAAEEQELIELRTLLDKTLVLGETPYERRVEAAVREALAKLVAETPPITDEAQEYELRRQLAELFGEEKEP